jgi:hypothetical protein
MRFWIRGAPHCQWRLHRFVRAAGLAAEGPVAIIEPPTDAVESLFRDFQRLDAKQRAQLWQRIWYCKTGRPDMTVDEVILKALESGDPVTVNDVLKRFADRVRVRLEKLRVRGVVVREGRGRSHREFTYKLVRPDRAAKAIGETGGGLARAAKREKNGDTDFIANSDAFA